jgi:Ca-activated chloride channel family protein
MAGLDMEGRSRFDLARDLVRDFADKRPSDAVGLAAVGSDAALLLPPTVDREALLARLENLRIGELGEGTALGMGIATAALHLRDSSAPRRVLTLITDGENNAGAIHPGTAAALLPGLGVSFWIMGVGSGGEVAIDYVDPLTRRRRTGTFESRFNAESLRAVARAGEGTYLAAPQAEAFSAAFARLDEEELVIRRSGLRAQTRPFHVPVLLAALGASLLVRIVRRFILGALW